MFALKVYVDIARMLGLRLPKAAAKMDAVSMELMSLSFNVAPSCPLFTDATNALRMASTFAQAGPRAAQVKPRQPTSHWQSHPEP
jgi:hypothetical protein